jgi:hypothetical protein
VTFTGEAKVFLSQLSLSAVGTPPREIAQGESISIPITVTNRMVDQVVSGTVKLGLMDYILETVVYSTSQNVTVLAGSSLVTHLVLDTTDVSEGEYLLAAVIESNGGQKRVFIEYLKVTQHRLYLPLILKNHKWHQGAIRSDQLRLPTP